MERRGLAILPLLLAGGEEKELEAMYGNRYPREAQVVAGTEDIDVTVPGRGVVKMKRMGLEPCGMIFIARDLGIVTLECFNKSDQVIIQNCVRVEQP